VVSRPAEEVNGYAHRLKGKGRLAVDRKSTNVALVRDRGETGPPEGRPRSPGFSGTDLPQLES